MSAQASAASSALRYGKSITVGAAFAIGWTPCIGPILGAILTLGASSGTVVKGAALLAVWSAGLGLPFLLAGLAMGQVMSGMRRLRPAMPAIEVLGGAVVILVGVLIFLDRFTAFNQYFSGAADLVVGAEGGLADFDINGPFGFAAAFLAGILAFLSPCCLPLVPAYLGHLAGLGADSGLAGQRATTFRHALAFVLGFSLVFVGLGASVGAIGYVVQDNLATIEKVAGIALIVLGLNLMGVIKIPLLYRTYALSVRE